MEASQKRAPWHRYMSDIGGVGVIVHVDAVGG
jgi:hypothetical protein